MPFNLRWRIFVEFQVRTSQLLMKRLLRYRKQNKNVPVVSRSAASCNGWLENRWSKDMLSTGSSHQAFSNLHLDYWIITSRSYIRGECFGGWYKYFTVSKGLFTSNWFFAGWFYRAAWPLLFGGPKQKHGAKCVEFNYMTGWNHAHSGDAHRDTNEFVTVKTLNIDKISLSYGNATVR